MASSKFRIRQGGLIEFDKKDNAYDAVKHFTLVCRYLTHMLNKMTYEDEKIYFEMKSIPLFNGVWLDSDYFERRQRAVEVDGKIKPFLVNYKHHLPTHQLSAIVEAASAFELFDI